MAFVNDFKPSSHSLVHLTMDNLRKLADLKIEHWDGDTEYALDARTRQPENWKEWLLIVVDQSERHLVTRNGAQHPTAGVIVTAFLRDRPQLSRFLMAEPVVTDEQVKHVVVQFEQLLRPTIELAARVRWAGELAELVQVDGYARRFPQHRDIHTIERYPSPWYGGDRTARITELQQWLGTDLLYPPA